MKDVWYHIIHGLFSKFGMADGDMIDEIQIEFSRHLTKCGFENRRITVSLHNRRVASIKVNGQWYNTVGLAEGPPSWHLWDEQTDEDVPVSKELEQAIFGFLPEAEQLFKPQEGNENA